MSVIRKSSNQSSVDRDRSSNLGGSIDLETNVRRRSSRRIDTVNNNFDDNIDGSFADDEINGAKLNRLFRIDDGTRSYVHG